MPRIYIGEVIVPPSIDAKIRPRGITGEQVKAACQAPAVPERAAWAFHPNHGRRLVVYARVDGNRLLKIVLQPVDVLDGTYRLRTAVVAGSSRRA